MGSHDRHTLRLLARIEAGQPVTQRSLSKDLGIALGLTNLLIRRVAKKGWVKVVSIRPNRVRYLITPAGIIEKTRITREYLDNTVQLYTETREQIRASLQVISDEWSEADMTAAGHRDHKPVVFYGAGEVAEIGYVSLQGTDLSLAGVVDDRRTGSFFHLPIDQPAALRAATLNGRPFGRLIVMSFKQAPQIRIQLEGLGFPAQRVCWLQPTAGRDAIGSSGRSTAP